MCCCFCVHWLLWCKQNVEICFSNMNICWRWLLDRFRFAAEMLKLHHIAQFAPETWMRKNSINSSLCEINSCLSWCWYRMMFLKQFGSCFWRVCLKMIQIKDCEAIVTFFHIIRQFSFRSRKDSGVVSGIIPAASHCFLKKTCLIIVCRRFTSGSLGFLITFQAHYCISKDVWCELYVPLCTQSTSSLYISCIRTWSCIILNLLTRVGLHVRIILFK